MLHIFSSWFTNHYQYSTVQYSNQILKIFSKFREIHVYIISSIWLLYASVIMLIIVTISKVICYIYMTNNDLLTIGQWSGTIYDQRSEGIYYVWGTHDLWRNIYSTLNQL